MKKQTKRGDDMKTDYLTDILEIVSVADMLLYNLVN